MMESSSFLGSAVFAGSEATVLVVAAESGAKTSGCESGGENAFMTVGSAAGVSTIFAGAELAGSSKAVIQSFWSMGFDTAAVVGVSISKWKGELAGTSALGFQATGADSSMIFCAWSKGFMADELAELSPSKVFS